MKKIIYLFLVLLIILLPLSSCGSSGDSSSYSPHITYSPAPTKYIELPPAPTIDPAKALEDLEEASPTFEYEPLPTFEYEPLPTFEYEPSTDESINITVYITKTGEKYHRDGCQYLRKSKIAISLEKAVKKGYTPCSKCDPPTLS